MKTLQDCKDRVAQRRNFDNWEHAENFGLWVWDLVRLSDNAAELYGRYMRFVGRAQVRNEDSVRAQHVEAFIKRREERRKEKGIEVTSSDIFPRTIKLKYIK